MIARTLNAYYVELAKQTRRGVTYLPPALVALLVLMAPLARPIARDDSSDYDFIAYALPTALNLFGIFILVIYCSSIVSSELSSGSIRLALVRPLKRSEYLLAIMLYGATYAVFLSAVGAAAAWGTALALGDIAGVTYGGEVVFTNAEMIRAFITAFSLSLFPFIAATTYSIMVSTFTRNTSTAIGLAVSVWLAIDLLKYPLRFEPFVFTTYLDHGWTVFADRCDALEASWFPGAYWTVATSLVSLICFFAAGALALSRRDFVA